MTAKTSVPQRQCPNRRRKPSVSSPSSAVKMSFFVVLGSSVSFVVSCSSCSKLGFESNDIFPASSVTLGLDVRDPVVRDLVVRVPRSTLRYVAPKTDRFDTVSVPFIGGVVFNAVVAQRVAPTVKVFGPFSKTPPLPILGARLEIHLMRTSGRHEMADSRSSRVGRVPSRGVSVSAQTSQ